MVLSKIFWFTEGWFFRKTWQSACMVYMIIIDGGCWLKFTFFGQGDEHVYVHACPRGSVPAMSLPQGKGGRVQVVVLGFCFWSWLMYTIPVDSGSVIMDFALWYLVCLFFHPWVLGLFIIRSRNWHFLWFCGVLLFIFIDFISVFDIFVKILSIF